MSEAYDLRAFFHAVGHFSGQRALTSNPTDRESPSIPVEMLEKHPQPVSAKPLTIAAFVDGIQAAIAVTYREHRPVYLNYVSAGAVAEAGRLIDVREKLSVVASSEDSDWVNSLGQNIPFEELLEKDPLEVEKAALANLAGDRESYERTLVEDLTLKEIGPLGLDGSLVGRPHLNSLLGIVKTTRRKYLADERVLYGLKAGWRSPIFMIPEDSAGKAPDRYSCYLRLFSAEEKPWNFGLIRLEAFTPDPLDALAARALIERQNPAGGDPRFDRHLVSVRACEDALRARRPNVFSLSH